MDSARSLTGARYGVIILLDDAGDPQDFHFSGMTELTRRSYSTNCRREYGCLNT